MHMARRKYPAGLWMSNVPAWPSSSPTSSAGKTIVVHVRQSNAMHHHGLPFCSIDRAGWELTTTTPLGRSPTVRHYCCSLVLGGQRKVARLDRWDIQVVSRQVNLGKEEERQWLRARRIERDSSRPGTTTC